MEPYVQESSYAYLVLAYNYYSKINESLEVTKLMQILSDDNGEVCMMLKTEMKDSHQQGLLGLN